MKKQEYFCGFSYLPLPCLIRSMLVFKLLLAILISSPFAGYSFTGGETSSITSSELRKKNNLNNDTNVDFNDQDQKKVKGVITDRGGQPVPGANITIEGTTRGVVTDVDGQYTIEVEPGENLVFSFIGFNTQVIKIQNQKIVNVELFETTEELEDVTVVAFAKQKRESVIGAISTVEPGDLKVPSSNLTTALAGRMAGIISYQRSGEPGQDNASFFIRGVTSFGYKVDPLILVDGIESTATDLARVPPDDIASFSIMKDATATALYGARGANGVILITTKEGKVGKAKVSVRYERSLSSNTQNIDVADPITYMQLENESVRTRNPIGALPYSQNKIDDTKAGLNPYAFPANDWMNELLNDYTTNQRVNMNISGGGKVARYYMAGTFSQDNGILKVDERNNFNSNIDLRNYQLRSNINVNITGTTEAIVRLSGTFDDYRGPIDGGAGMFSKIMGSNPVLFPAYYPSDKKPYSNHILFGNSANRSANGAPSYINPYADMVKGFKDYSRSRMMAQFQMKQDLKFILPGLSARMLFNTERYSFFDVSRFYNPYYYSAYGYNRLDDTYDIRLLNELTGTEYLNYSEGSKDINSSTYLEAAINYQAVFADKHEVSGLLVAIRRNQLFANQGSLQQSLPYRNQGVSGRFTYAYDSRYMAELNFGYNGSERFHSSQRYGFFPSAGLAWFVSKEPLWEGLSRTFPKLKLKATYGLVGNDAIGSANDRFFYLSEVSLNDGNYGAAFGNRYNYTRNGVSVSRYANNDITWETASKLNAGFELNVFNSIEIQAEYFAEDRENILMDRAFIPTTMGLSAGVRANLGKAKSNGVDISVDYNKSFNNNLWMQGRANFTYAHSEYVFYEEPNYDESEKNLAHKGQSLSQVWGLVAERLFIDEEDVVNNPRQNFGEYAAGDIKYRDVNGDGQITDLDRVPIGHPTVPEIIYGGGLSMGYKSVDFSFFLQGSARSSFWIDAVRTAPFIATRDYYNNPVTGSQNVLLQTYADNYWSESDRDIYALWPRLSSTLSQNNTQTSTWFMRNGAFLRVKSVELGYTLPKAMVERIHLDNMRFYVSGTNLFNFTKFKLWDVEMGGNGLGYPIQRVINLGVTVNF